MTILFTLLKLLDYEGIQRSKKQIFYKGSQWFSITDEFARYVLAERRMIHKVFGLTNCSDEIFRQTIIMNSPFANTVDASIGNLRLIDWKRGEPYIFLNSDFSELIGSEKLWARKFSVDVDREVIDRIQNYLLSLLLIPNHIRNIPDNDSNFITACSFAVVAKGIEILNLETVFDFLTSVHNPHIFTDRHYHIFASLAGTVIGNQK